MSDFAVPTSYHSLDVDVDPKGKSSKRKKTAILSNNIPR